MPTLALFSATVLWWIDLAAAFLGGIVVGMLLTRFNARVLWQEYLRAKHEDEEHDQPAGPKLEPTTRGGRA